MSIPIVLEPAVDTVEAVEVEPGSPGDPLPCVPEVDGNDLDVDDETQIYRSRIELPHTFARMLQDAFRRFGETEPLFYDEGSFTLYLDGDDRSFWIGNLFEEFLRTKAKNWRGFFEDAWEIWCVVQGELTGDIPGRIEILRPFRDERHPLSYHVESVTGTHLWQIVPPFEDTSTECFGLVDAYRVWWSNQVQRSDKAHYRNAHEWLETGQLTLKELALLVELRRLWRQQRLVATTDDRRLGHEIASLGSRPVLSPLLREFLDNAAQSFGSEERALAAFRTLREQEA